MYSNELTSLVALKRQRDEVVGWFPVRVAYRLLRAEKCTQTIISYARRGRNVHNQKRLIKD